jgi:hypothetical protein
MPADEAQRSSARVALDQRWQELLSQELKYRSPPRRTAIAG